MTDSRSLFNTKEEHWLRVRQPGRGVLQRGHIGAWDVSGVTAMTVYVRRRPSFDEDIGGWAVHSPRT